VLLFTAAAGKFDLTIMHTNDVHARFVEPHKYGGNCNDNHKTDGDCVGGAARR